MHPDVEKIVAKLPPEVLAKFNNHDAKFEFFAKHCTECIRTTVHRFSVNNELAMGVCQHAWKWTREDFAALERVRAEGQEGEHNDLPTTRPGAGDQAAP